MVWKRSAIVLVLLAALSSVVFAAPPAPCAPQAETPLLSQILSASASPAAVAPVQLASGHLPTKSVCSQCITSHCPSLCGGDPYAHCQLDPDTGCFFCSCFLNP
jgi:hypothetical protein